MSVDDDTRSKLLGIWEALGRPEPPDIPPEALISEGIDVEDYNEWRLDLEDEKIRAVKLRADAAVVDAREADLRARGMEPMPPRRTPDEIAEIERREQEADERASRRRERADQAEWLPEDDEG
ncbi:MAG: hypothetical protein H0U46_04505 [Actinobacteria bacterium]|nr:hypothetical protein [Actinomycetota bacterium]